MQVNKSPSEFAPAKRTHLLAKLITYFLISLFLLITIFLGWLYYSLNKPMTIKGQPLIVEIKANSTATALVQTLYQRGFIDSKSFLQHYIKYKGLANQLKAGAYLIKPGESATHFVNRIVNGDVLTAAFRIIEGSNVYQVKSNLAKAPYLNYQADDWLAIKGSYPSAEGLLLANTYYYGAGSHAKKILLNANKKLLLVLNENWETRSPNLPYKTPYELLIAASILEKESSLPEERRVIAGIVVNRLKKRMALQMDPTVIYALGPHFEGKLGHHDLDFNSPYNTYRYKGLPPTPIAMVGQDAIDAAAHPQFSNYLYFVAKGDGTHIFSATYEEQKEAIARYMNKEKK